MCSVRNIFFLGIVLIVTIGCKRNEIEENRESNRILDSVKVPFEIKKSKDSSSAVLVTKEKGVNSTQGIKNDENSYSNNILLNYKEILAQNNELTQQNFIRSFPNTFEEMHDLFGYDENEGPGIYYDNNFGGAMIKLFSELDPINKSVYYKKYIDICLNGQWEADHIRKGFGIYKKLIERPIDAYSYLAIREDKEIQSVFRFILDGPHPNNDENKHLLKDIKDAIPPSETRMQNLLENTFDEMINENHSH